MRTINKVIIHCSDSTFGNAKQINNWHKEKGFSSIGYHYVIMNGRHIKYCDPKTIFYGKLETGRPIEEVGAHCIGENENSIGICLIGVDEFLSEQFKTLTDLVLSLIYKYGLTVDKVLGHYETESGRRQGKTCPNFDMVKFREELKQQVLNGHE